VEAVSSPSFSGWSSSDDDSERNLEDDEDALTEMPKDSPCLEWCEEAEHKAEGEEDEMLEEQEALLESFATARKEETTCVATAEAILAEASPCGPVHVPACPQFLVERFDKIEQIWKAATERRKAFEGKASCSMKGESVAATSSSPRTTKSDVLRVVLVSIASLFLCVIYFKSYIM
jgi:hypothetical protein